MITPQQIDQVAFKKSSFGGYNMQQVDEFLEPLTEDYVTLYKENALLKSKLRVLAGKLEEYRKGEGAAKAPAADPQALQNAQAQAAQVLQTAQVQAAQAVKSAQAQAAQILADAQDHLDVFSQAPPFGSAARTGRSCGPSMFIRTTPGCLSRSRLCGKGILTNS